MKQLIEKYVLYKQTKCIEAILYVIDVKNIDIYFKGKRLISYNTGFVNMEGHKSPLEYIRDYYIKELEFKKKHYKTNEDKLVDELLMNQFINENKRIIEKLSDEFIEKYNKISDCIKYVEDNKKYLTDEQIDKYLTEFYIITGNNLGYERIKHRTRTVK